MAHATLDLPRQDMICRLRHKSSEAGRQPFDSGLHPLHADSQRDTVYSFHHEQQRGGLVAPLLEGSPPQHDCDDSSHVGRLR